MNNLAEVYDPPIAGKDYIVQVKIKNGPLLRAIRMRGYKTIKAFAEACRADLTSIYGYLALTRTPLNNKSNWRPSALKMAACLRLPPDSLFPEQHLEHVLAKSSGEIEVSKEEVAALIAPDIPPDPEQLLIAQDVSNAITKLFSKLTPREERVIRQRFGFNRETKTLDEVAEQLGFCTRERIRQIEQKALRKLRRHAKSIHAATDQYRRPCFTNETHLPPVDLTVDKEGVAREIAELRQIARKNNSPPTPVESYVAARRHVIAKHTERRRSNAERDAARLQDPRNWTDEQLKEKIIEASHTDWFTAKKFCEHFELPWHYDNLVLKLCYDLVGEGRLKCR